MPAATAAIFNIQGKGIIKATGQTYWSVKGLHDSYMVIRLDAHTLWPTDAGGHAVEAHLVRTLIHRVGACQLLCVRQGASVRYFVTSDLNATLEQVVGWVALRWEIETFFEDLKDVLGTDHYQVLHDQAILRIWTLACCAYRFLATIQATHPTHISIGQCRRSVRDEHQRALLIWLQQQFAAGRSPDDLAYLASFLAS